MLVVRASETSIDNRERLIPYIEDDVVLSVDLATRLLTSIGIPMTDQWLRCVTGFYQHFPEMLSG